MLRVWSRLPSATRWARQTLMNATAHACTCDVPNSRGFSSEPEAQSTEPAASDNVRRLADEIMGLTVLECSQLTDILRKKLGMQRPAFGGMMPMMGAATPAAAAPAAPAAAEKKEEVKKEQTEFTVKLDSFSADGKIKVIKEVRAITGLGLKEAKELVEKAPVIIKANLSKADADAMKKSLEDVGGKITLE